MNYLCIDVGGTFIKFAVIDKTGDFKSSWKSHSPDSLDTFKHLIKSQISIHSNEINGISMSCPGRVDCEKGYLYTCGSILFLYEFSMRDWLLTITDLPFAIINDGKAAALAEWWIGNLKNVENGAAIVMGTGVGGGFIWQNSLYQGNHFQAGELSFILSENRLNSNLDILAYSVSAVQFMTSASKILEVDTNEYETIFHSIICKSNLELTKLFEGYCRSIAILIINLQSTLDLDKVVIGGGISKQDIFISEVKEAYEKVRSELPLLGQTFGAIPIEACLYRNSSNLLGALYNLLKGNTMTS